MSQEDDQTDGVPFYIIPDVVMRNPYLSSGAKLLFSVIHEFRISTDGFDSSDSLLMSHTGIPTQDIPPLLKELEDLEYIRIKHGKRKRGIHINLDYRDRYEDASGKMSRVLFEDPDDDGSEKFSLAVWEPYLPESFQAA
jgi:hypothetical protein